ncbi:MAG: ABC transporter ATP-binding protein [Symbiobacterium sp.]|uniref:ABC transporter ATP-binding protein n=1 Tax=Symbiobacterium sp. TaxID=1971213 RepID=UPI0034646B4B
MTGRGESPAAAPMMITARHVSYAYKETVALRDVSFDLPMGETLAVVGPSGCGKTTLLSLLAGLLPVTSGAIAVGGAPVQPRRPGTALILQDYGLLPWKTVRENVALGLRIRGLKPDGADRALREVGLADLAGRWPHQLSGGQKQRVAIARSLALEPDLLLMDEPFSALDALTREEMQELLLSIWRKRKTSLVLVTHSIPEAVYLGQQILVLTARPGRVAGLFRNPAVGDRRAAAFHEMVNRVRDALERGVNGGA